MDPIFQKLAQKEEEFLQTEFFAPVFSDAVRVKIENITVDFKVQPATFRGWGIFKSAGKKNAAFIRDASLSEIAAYLENFDRTSFIVCDNDRVPLGISASQDSFFTTDATPFFLANNVQLFDTVYVRFDGANFIYERSSTGSARNSARLRSALNDNIKPANLEGLGLTKFEKIAYNFVYELRKQKELQSTEGRVRSAIQRGGGQYQSYRRVSGNIVVTYQIEGEVFTSTVSENLSVVSAGICLSGTDRTHDLQSLMSVIKEGRRRGLIHRF